MSVVFNCSQQSFHDDDDGVLQSRCNLVSCSHRPSTLRPSISFRSTPETLPADGEKKCAERTSGSSESGSVVSPLHLFARRRRVSRQHNSFNSYFRPPVKSRCQCPLDPPPLSPRSPDQSPPPPPPSPSSPPHRVYRKQIVRETCSAKLTPTTRRGQQAADATRSPSVRGGSGAAMRRRSVFGHITGGTGGVPPAGLGRRNTVAGGGAVERLPPPIPLSLREIYRLSRHGSVLSHHGRRLSTFSAKRDSTWTSKGSVGVSRGESSCSRRVALPASERVATGDCDHDVIDIRRRRSYVEQKHRSARRHDEPQQSLLSRTSHDNSVSDASKTHTFSIILVILF